MYVVNEKPGIRKDNLLPFAGFAPCAAAGALRMA